MCGCAKLGLDDMTCMCVRVCVPEQREAAVEHEIRQLEQRVSDLEFQLRSQQRFLEHVLTKIGEQPRDVDPGRQDRMRQPLRQRHAGVGF